MAGDGNTDEYARDNTKKFDSKDYNKDSITLSKHTFYKLAIIGIVGLVTAAFFIGYTVHSITHPAALIADVSTTPSEEPPTPVTVSNISIGNAPTIGSDNAPITVVEFSDFQCPFCASFFSNTLSQIKTEYVDTGKIKFVYKHYPLDFHQNAKIAAVASECANEQGKFWEYHNVLLGNQSAWETLSGNDTVKTFVGYSESLGLDSNYFRDCLSSLKYERYVDSDLEEGSKLGVTGTPSFFVGKEGKYTLVEGAQPFESFRQTIDQLG